MSLYNMQVKRHFNRCQIVGSRFPIALVHWGGTVLEVSSFGTKAKRNTIPTDAAALLSWPPPHSKASPCRCTLHALCPRPLAAVQESSIPRGAQPQQAMLMDIACKATACGRSCLGAGAITLVQLVGMGELAFVSSCPSPHIATWSTLHSDA